MTSRDAPHRSLLNLPAGAALPMSTRSSWPRTGPAREPLEHECLIEKSSVDITGLRRHDALDDVKILGRILLPMLARFTEEHADTLYIAPTRPLAIKRHPPVKS